MTRFRAALALLAVLATVRTARADTLQFQDGVAPNTDYAGTRDVSIGLTNDLVFDPDTNYNGQTNGVDAWTSKKGVLMRWDISAIPTTETVTSAAIISFVTNNTPTSGFPIYEMKRAWDVNQATWNRANSTTFWAAPGALGAGTDFGSTVAVTGTTALNSQTWNLNANGVTMVQGWVSNAGQNFGVMVRDYANTDGYAWTSAEGTTAANRPHLHVVTNVKSYDFQDGVSPTVGYAGQVDTVIATGFPSGTNQNGWTIGLGGDSPLFNGLVSFDLSVMPAGAIVTGATLHFTTARTSSAGFTVYEMLQPWVETEATWTNLSSTTAWQTPGGEGAADHGVTVLGTVIPSSSAVDVTLNSAGVQRVQSWIDSPAGNHGVIFFNTGITVPAQLMDRENAVPSSRPMLSVVFTPPPGYDAGSITSKPDAGKDAGRSGLSVFDSGEGPHLDVGTGCTTSGGSALLGLSSAVLIGLLLKRKHPRSF